VTVLVLDANGVPLQGSLPWGRTQVVENEYATATRTASRITQGVRLVTLVSRDAGASDVHFAVGPQDTVEADADDPTIPPGGVVDVPVPADLAADADAGAGISILSLDDVTVRVVERA